MKIIIGSGPAVTWLRHTVMSRDTVRSVSRHSATPPSPPRVCWCQVYLCHMSLCFIFFSCVTEVESVSGYTGPSFDGGRGSIRPFLYKPLKVIFLVSGTKGKYHKRIGKITYFMANVWQRGSHGHIALPHCNSK